MKKDKILAELKKSLNEMKDMYGFIFGAIFIFLIFIPLFAIYAWFMGVIIRSIMIIIFEHEPVGMKWFVYGVVAGGISSMIVQGIQEGKKSLKELFKVLLAYFVYFGLIFVALTIWAIIIALLKIHHII